MESLLLKELKEELLGLKSLLSLNEKLDEEDTDYLEGRMDEVEWVMDLVKQLKQK